MNNPHIIPLDVIQLVSAYALILLSLAFAHLQQIGHEKQLLWSGLNAPSRLGATSRQSAQEAIRNAYSTALRPGGTTQEVQCTESFQSPQLNKLHRFFNLSLFKPSVH